MDGNVHFLKDDGASFIVYRIIVGEPQEMKSSEACNLAYSQVGLTHRKCLPCRMGSRSYA
jgi:hypothetical protein